MTTARPLLALLLAALFAACGSRDLVGDPDCPAGQVACPGGCTRPETDPDHCGACGVACGASAFCSAGRCTPCPTGQTRCGNTCVALASDPAHCGACGVTCAAPQRCQSGVCR